MYKVKLSAFIMKVHIACYVKEGKRELREDK
jgi:hypothetical protein